MDGYQYEQKCAELLKAKGFSKVQVTPGSGDQGVDVIAYRSKKKYGVQCKYYEGTVGNKAIQEVYAGSAYYNCNAALVISNSTFTKSAKELADRLNVELWENVDAIYLQKHTAEYIKKEKALQQKKKEQQQQRRLQLKEENQRKRELKIKERAEAEKQAKELEESGELDQKRKYIQPAAKLLAVSLNGFAYVRPDGTVASCSGIYNGKSYLGDTLRFTNIKSVVCTDNGIVGLRNDGSCIATNPGYGYAYISECNNWTNIIDIAAVEHQVVGLRSDGTCVANIIERNPVYGNFGQSNVSEWKNIVQVACGGDFSLGLQSNGHVLFAGKSYWSSSEEIARWSNIKMIAACGKLAVGLTNEGKIISTGGITTAGIKPEKGILQLGIFGLNIYALYADGSVGCGGEYQSLKIEEKDVISIVSSSHYPFLCVLKKTGEIHTYGHGQKPGFVFDPNNSCIFENYDQLLEEKARQKEWRDQGLCQHCGGAFKGVIVKKCSACQRKKDY